MQYEQADGSQKDSLRILIITEASTVDLSKLPSDEQAFIHQLRGY
jgi:hypothetical protein